jgi:hypothetical protein
MQNDDAVPVPTSAVGPPDLPSPDVSALPDSTANAVAKASTAAPKSSDVATAEAGKGGEAGIPTVTNAEFVAAIYGDGPDGAKVAICSKAGDPGEGGWYAQVGVDVDNQCPPGNNNYVNCSSFYPPADKELKARKENFAACHVIFFDDIGSKVPRERFDGINLTWLIETSPGNFQGGIALAMPMTDAEKTAQLHDAIVGAGYCDPGVSDLLTRWIRLPVGINGKPQHRDGNGNSYRCRLVVWKPEKRYTLDEILALLKVTLGSGKKARKVCQAIRSVLDPETVLLPKAPENPVIKALKEAGLYKTPLGSGKHDITCPWVHEHTGGADNGTAYFEPNESFPTGDFRCHHSHGDHYHIHELLEYLGVLKIAARHKAVIRIIAGDLHIVVNAAEEQLASLGRHFQAGDLIVSVETDPVTGDPSIVPTSAPALTRELSVAVIWEKYDGRTKEWKRCDPPARHLGILFDSRTFRYLPQLKGVVRQPYFREADGVLVTEPGYDPVSQRFGVFDPRQYVLGKLTKDGARQALAMLEALLIEFHFVAPTDKAAALSAIFTAVVRVSLPLAPAFHARAPVFGSGKTYLCELIGVFAGPGGNAKVSYPTTSEEATKVVLALLLTSPAVIEFDDMDTDWIPHGVIKRMLTTDQITDRILGVSKTATVSTRTLFLGSGNNVGPIRDLLRRVLTIHVDPRCATPATMAYSGNPVDKVRKNRGAYVAAVLTIIRAWQEAGSPRAEIDNIVSYGGAWSDYCRFPLMWLGLPDPATALLAQVRHDPDGDALLGLMTAWHRAFGSKPTTVRNAVDRAFSVDAELLDAMREFPIEERGDINRSKLGWLLKKNANRIVGSFEFRQGTADGRVAWCVVQVTPPPLPALPDSPDQDPKIDIDNLF